MGYVDVKHHVYLLKISLSSELTGTRLVLGYTCSVQHVNWIVEPGFVDTACPSVQYLWCGGCVWADYGALHFIVSLEDEQTLRCVFIWHEGIVGAGND